MTDFFEPSEYYTGPVLTDSLVAHAQEILGVILPRSYIDLLRVRNGGVPRRRCFHTNFSTSWAKDHFEVQAVRGIGGDWGIDSVQGLGSGDMIREWEYPPIGVVVCDTPAAGADTVMLDYRGVSGIGEPSIAYVDEDRIPRTVASTFSQFIRGLTES